MVLARRIAWRQRGPLNDFQFADSGLGITGHGTGVDRDLTADRILPTVRSLPERELRLAGHAAARGRMRAFMPPNLPVARFQLLDLALFGLAQRFAVGPHAGLPGVPRIGFCLARSLTGSILSLVLRFEGKARDRRSGPYPACLRPCRILTGRALFRCSRDGTTVRGPGRSRAGYRRKHRIDLKRRHRRDRSAIQPPLLRAVKHRTIKQNRTVHRLTKHQPCKPINYCKKCYLKNNFTSNNGKFMLTILTATTARF